ncbi:hypothetical protein RM543_12225 [Roseicyclus sp. F158]|uniref:Uncharacterized protein n=1 Tax=Tropicimonas omnivorans TaxID=3075590 RepID=A0ABU3DIB2_9RHOB|nr:hypothetical protein [Roseicyclus sp. F158]MDT0683454.1 hypothetical protein [Roseicyclus sp. F158]
MRDEIRFIEGPRRYLWPLRLCLAGIAAVFLGFWGVTGYCKATFISSNPYCSATVEYLFVALCLVGLVTASVSLFVLVWRVFRSPR